MALKSSGKSGCVVASPSNHRVVTAPQTYQSASYMRSQRIPQPSSLIQYLFGIRRRTIEISVLNAYFYRFSIYTYIKIIIAKFSRLINIFIRVINNTKTSIFNGYLLESIHFFPSQYTRQYTT